MLTQLAGYICDLVSMVSRSFLSGRVAYIGWICVCVDVGAGVHVLGLFGDDFRLREGKIMLVQGEVLRPWSTYPRPFS